MGIKPESLQPAAAVSLLVVALMIFELLTCGAAAAVWTFSFLLISALQTLQWFTHHVVIWLLLLEETRDRHLSVVSPQLQLQNGLDAPHQAALAVPVRSARIYHPGE